ncbi:MAG: 50S ribosomal protein L25 [Bacteroidales bacterium]|nr:50S ribosomal protein L25 [Bacteroidales bacterium]
MQHFALNGQVRETGNKAVIKALRKQGLVPCNLYGLGLENVLFTVTAKELKALTNNPASFIVDLSLSDGKKYTAILHELQWHPVSDECLHVDFLAVDEKKPIVMEIPVTVSGHSKGVMAGGKFTQVSRKLKVSGLQKDLPDTLPVDISDLDLDKQIVAGDLKFENLTILTDKNVIVCRVKSTRQMIAAAKA